MAIFLKSNMNDEEVLECVKYVNFRLSQKGMPPLRDLEKNILIGYLQGKSHRQIAREHGYTELYLARDAGPKFRQLLSDLLDLEQTVTKLRVKSVLEPLFQEQKAQLAPRQHDLLPISSQERLLSELIDDIRQQKLQLLYLHGAHGRGKKHFIDELVRRLSRIQIVSYFISLERGKGTTDFFGDVLTKLGMAADDIPASSHQRREQIVSFLKQRQCLLIIRNGDRILESKLLVSNYLPENREYGDFIRQITEETHKSCVIWLSREPPVDQQERVFYDIDNRVRVELLEKLSATETRNLIQTEYEIEGQDGDWRQLTEWFGGNRFLLEQAAEEISRQYGGQLGRYLSRRLEITNTLKEYFDGDWHHLIEAERLTLYWIALAQGCLSYADLDESRRCRTPALADVIDSLERRRYLCTRDIEGNHIISTSLQVYVLGHLIAEMLSELISGKASLLHDVCLMQTTVDADVKAQQCERIVAPLVNQLKHHWTTPEQCIEGLRHCIDAVRASGFDQNSYAAGNLITICHELDIDLQRFNFTHLAIRQVDFQSMTLHGVNFSECYFKDCTWAYALAEEIVLAFNYDGTLAAIGDSEGRIILWNILERKIERFYKAVRSGEGEIVAIRSLTFQLDGNLYIASSDNNILLWDLQRGSETPKFLTTGRPIESPARFIKAANQDSQLVIADDRNCISILDKRTGLLQRSFETQHEDEILSLAYSSRHGLVASHDLHTIKFWDANTRKLKKIWPSRGGEIHVVAIARNEFFQSEPKITFAECIDCEIKLHHWSDSKGCQEVFQKPLKNPFQGTIRALALSPDTNYIASLDDTQRLCVWNVTEEKPQREQVVDLDIHAHRMVFSNDSTLLASIGTYQVSLRETLTGKEYKRLKGYWRLTTSIAIAPNPRLVATGHHDGVIRLWNWETRKYVCCFRAGAASVEHLSMSPDGRWLVAGDENNQVYLRDFEKDTLVGLPELQGAIHDIQFSSDSSQFAIAAYQAQIPIFTTGNNNNPRQLSFRDSTSVRCVSLSSSQSSRMMAASNNRGQIKIWRLNQGNSSTNLDGHSTQVKSLHFNSEGNQLLSHSLYEVRLWSLDSRQSENFSAPEGSTILAANFDRAGAILALLQTSQPRAQIMLWKPQSEKTPHPTLVAPPVSKALFVPNTDILISLQKPGKVSVLECDSDYDPDSFNTHHPYARLMLSRAMGLNHYEMRVIEEQGAQL